MAVPLIMNAISYGYTAKTILGHVAKQFPKYAKPINAALTYGFPAAAVLKKIVNPKSSASNTDDFLTEHERTLKNYKSQKNKATGQLAAGIAGVAALGAGAAGLIGRGAAAGAQGLASGALTHQPTTINVTPVGAGGNSASATSSLPLVIPQTTPAQPQPNAPSGGITMQGMIDQGVALGQKPQVAEQPVTSSPTPQAPIPQVTLQPDEQKVLDQFPQVMRFVDSHVAKGKSPEEIYNIAKSSKAVAPIIENFEKIHGTPFSAVIQQRASPQQVKPELPLQMKGPTPQKADVVITPFGAGNVHKVHGKDAYVEVDNKLKKVPVEEIEEPIKSVQKSVADFLQIPEEDRSGPVAMWFHDPDGESMWVQWHHKGQLTKYKGFPSSLLQDIASKNAIPITTGENEFGMWSPNDKKSLGAAIDQYIKKDPRWKKAGKGEANNPNYVTYEPGFDYWEKLRSKPKRK